jgi:O-antigen/teichoic acid export membrane protein
VIDSVAGIGPPRGRVQLWARRGSWALVDHVLFASSMLVVNLLLARSLTPAAYGAFAVAFLLFMLAGTLHTAALTEPLLVYGSGKYRDSLGAYVRVLLIGHALVAAAISCVFLIAASACWLAHAHTLATTFAALAAASPFVLLLWLLRRVFYVQMRPQRAAIGDGLFLGLSVGALTAIAQFGEVGPASALLGIGVAGALASLVLLRLLQVPPEVPLRVRDVAREHWAYGRWNALEQGLYWVSAQSVIVLVPIVLGLREAAVVAAVVNLFRPLHPAMQSTTSLMLPALTARNGGTSFRWILRVVVAPYAASVALYGALLVIFARPLMHHLYAGRYDGYTTIVVFFALAYTATTVIQTLTVFLKATGRIRQVPALWGISGLVTIPLAYPAMKLGGLNGGMTLFVLSYVAAAGFAVARVRKVMVER